MALKTCVSIEFDSKEEKQQFFDYVLNHRRIWSINEDNVAEDLCLFYDEYTALADHFSKEEVHSLCGELVAYITTMLKENCGLED